MSRLLTRISQEADAFRRRVTGSYAQGTNRPASRLVASQWSDYDLRDMMLDGTVYNSTTNGGALRAVLKSLGRPCGSGDEGKYPISGYFNPVKSIVSFYANAFGGTLGGDLKIADEVNDRAVRPAMKAVVRRLWEWSGLNTRVGEMTELSANQGGVGIRIVYRAGPPQRVYLDFDHPAMVKRIDMDNRGNVVTAFLDYTGQAFDEDGNVAEQFQVEEVISKYGFSKLHDGEEQLTPAQRENPLGVCPYVWLRQEPIPGQWIGRHAYEGSERAIHGINFGLSQLDESVVAHVWPYLFATAAAKKPTKFTTNKYTLIYAQSEAGKPPPTLDTMVPALDFTGSIEHLQQLVTFVRDRNPQMVLNDLKLLSGISGEALQAVKAASEAESLRARVFYEDGIVRAVQIAASLGVYFSVPGFDLGTGTGTVEAADRAFGDGDGPEAFAFTQRPALPPTVFQKIQQATANVADKKASLELVAAAKRAGLSQRESLRLGGYTDEEINAIEAEIAEQDTLPEDDDSELE